MFEMRTLNFVPCFYYIFLACRQKKQKETGQLAKSTLLYLKQLGQLDGGSSQEQVSVVDHFRVVLLPQMCRHDVARSSKSNS